MNPILFPFSEYWWFYLSFSGFVLLILCLDLGVFHKKIHAIKTKEAIGWSVFWVGLALIFNYLFYLYALWKFPQDPRLVGLDHQALATQSGLEFLTGFVVEKALAIDNIFIFVVVFSYFAIPPKYQHRVLFYGIIGALLFRAIFIALGSILMQYKWIVILFGAFLILTGIKIFLVPQKPIDPSKNLIIKILKRFLPISAHLDQHNFFIRKEGILYATPLFLALIFIEISDIIFAIDSVPAIFALTKEPLIVFTSNVLAILGLRALYFVLAGLYHKFHMLKFGLGLVLIFVGLKMVWLNELFGGKFPVLWSISIIFCLISSTIALSWLIPNKASQKA